MLCFAGQNVSRKMGGEAFPAGGFETRSIRPWSATLWNGRFRWHFANLKLLVFWRKSRTTASFSHLQLSLLEGSLAPKLRFHIFNFHFWRDVSRQSFLFTSSTFRFWGTSRTKASFSHLPLPDFEGRLAPKLRFHIFHFQILEGRLARKLRFHIFHFHFLSEVSHEMRFWMLAVFCRTKRVPEDGWGSFSGGAVSRHARLNRDHGRIGRAVELTVQLFPRASERRVLLIVGVCDNIFKSSHLLIFTSSHLHICSSSHLFIFTSSHLHICSSSHLQILSCPLALLPSCSLALLLSPSFLFLSWRRRAVPTRRHETQPFRTKWGSIAQNCGKIAISGFPSQPFRTKWCSIAKNWGKIAISRVRSQPFRTKWCSIAKNCGKIVISGFPSQLFRTKWDSIAENRGVKLRFQEMMFDRQKLG